MAIKWVYIAHFDFFVPTVYYKVNLLYQTILMSLTSEIEKILRTQNGLKIIPHLKDIEAYLQEGCDGDYNTLRIYKVLSSRCIDAIKLIPKDKLKDIAASDEGAAYRILSSQRDYAIQCIPENRFIELIKKDEGIKRILASQRALACSKIPYDVLYRYVYECSSDVEIDTRKKAILSSGLKAKIKRYLLNKESLPNFPKPKTRQPHKKLIKTAIEVILETKNSKKIRSHLKEVESYLKEEDDSNYTLRVYKILASKCAAAIRLIPKDKLQGICKTDEGIYKILASTCAEAIQLIPKDKLQKIGATDAGAYKILASKCIEAIKLIPTFKFESLAITKKGFYKLLSYQCKFAIQHIPESRFRELMQKDEVIEKILSIRNTFVCSKIPYSALERYYSACSTAVERNKRQIKIQLSCLPANIKHSLLNNGTIQEIEISANETLNIPSISATKEKPTLDDYAERNSMPEEQQVVSDDPDIDSFAPSLPDAFSQIKDIGINANETLASSDEQWNELFPLPDNNNGENESLQFSFNNSQSEQSSAVLPQLLMTDNYDTNDLVDSFSPTEDDDIFSLIPNDDPFRILDWPLSPKYDDNDNTFLLTSLNTPQQQAQGLGTSLNDSEVPDQSLAMLKSVPDINCQEQYKTDTSAKRNYGGTIQEGDLHSSQSSGLMQHGFFSMPTSIRGCIDSLLIDDGELSPKRPSKCNLDDNPGNVAKP